jgi:hypothetical protein
MLLVRPYEHLRPSVNSNDLRYRGIPAPSRMTEELPSLSKCARETLLRDEVPSVTGKM